MDMRLVRLRIELFTAMQTLTGDELKEFWKLIDELVACRDAFYARPEGR